MQTVESVTRAKNTISRLNRHIFSFVALFMVINLTQSISFEKTDDVDQKHFDTPISRLKFNRYCNRNKIKYHW